MKKLSALVLALIMLWACIVPVCASPLEAFYTADISIDPGNPRADNPEYSYAWLDNIVIRSDPNAVTSAEIRPTPDDYLYECTYEEFVSEVNNYSLLFKLDEDTVGSAYNELTALIYYAVTAMGFTSDYETMCSYLRDYGIALSADNALESAMSVAVVYAALKYNAVYVLYEKQVEIPVGSTVNQALVIILSALTGIMLPSGIDTLSGLGVLAIKNYVSEFEQLPVSDNPDSEEVFHWAKIITAAENGYQVPLADYHVATKAQKEYVDYAYYASILNTIYDINVDPFRLVIAMQSTEENSLQKFILKTMLDEKGVVYTAESTCEELFKLACQNGYFALENDFYTDIFSYEFKVASSCEKVWFTPFGLASQLEGGDNAYLTVYLNGSKMAINSTVSTPLDPQKSNETVDLKVVYDDGRNPVEEAVYRFKVIKDTSLDTEKKPVAENDMVGQVEQFIGTIIPNSNSVANEKVDEIFSSIDSAFSQAVSNIDMSTLTTYNMEASAPYFDVQDITDLNTDTSASVQTTASGSRFDFNYLEQLIDGVYVTDADGNIVTTSALSGEDSNSEQNIIEKVSETVKESPEVVAVPSSFLAAFGFMGYFMTKKHREDPYKERETEDEENDG